MVNTEQFSVGVFYFNGGLMCRETSLKDLHVAHPASDHLQVLKHGEVGQLLWPRIDVQIPWHENQARLIRLLCGFK